MKFSTFLLTNNELVIQKPQVHLHPFDSQNIYTITRQVNPRDLGIMVLKIIAFLTLNFTSI